jgi:hypothetical protein
MQLEVALKVKYQSGLRAKGLGQDVHLGREGWEEARMGRTRPLCACPQPTALFGTYISLSRTTEFALNTFSIF